MICGSRKLRTRPSVMEKSRKNEGRVTLQREELGVGVGLGVSRKMGGSREGKRKSDGFPVSLESLRRPGPASSNTVCKQVNSYQRPSSGTSSPSHPPLGDLTATLIVPIPFCLTRGIALTTKQKLSGKGWLLPPHTGDCLTQLTRMSSAKVQLQEQPPMTSHKLSCDRILPNKIKFIYLRFNLILHLTQRLLVYSYSCTTMPTVQVKNISIIPPPKKITITIGCPSSALFLHSPSHD